MQNICTAEEIRVPTMLTIRETAEFFGVPVHFVRSKVANGEVHAVKAGKKFLVNAQRFSEFLNGDDSIKTTVAENIANDRRIQPIPLRLR